MASSSPPDLRPGQQVFVTNKPSAYSGQDDPTRWRVEQLTFDRTTKNYVFFRVRGRLERRARASIHLFPTEPELLAFLRTERREYTEKLERALARVREWGSVTIHTVPADQPPAAGPGELQL